MVKELSNSKGFLIDGYPREKAQGELFEQNVSFLDKIIQDGESIFFARCLSQLSQLTSRSQTSFEDSKIVSVPIF